MSNKLALHLYDVIKRPLVSEKTQMLLEKANQYTFEILPSATKADVKKAVEFLFNVTVESVNTINKCGKNKTFRGRKGLRQDTKKAIVRVAEGQTINYGAER